MADGDGLRFNIPTERNSAIPDLNRTWSRKSRRSVVSPDEENGITSSKDIESLFGADDGPNIRDSDLKRKQVFKGWTLLWLAYQSTGVIYGDIGTSPLYVYSSTFTSDPSFVDLLGALSLIIWSLTLIVTIKYVCIVLCADDEGEGGTFALYSLLARYSHISKRDPKTANTVKFERYATGELPKSNWTVREFIERSRAAHGLLKVLAVFGVSLILADSILTPAQSVLGAIQGLQVINPNITTKTVVGVSCGILILLFFVQPLGITKLGSVFAPIVIVWLVFNLASGIYNLIYHDWTVLKAFSPYFAGAFLMRNGVDGWKALGGILLAFTGVEALFADLGAFSARAIRISWCFFVYPSLLLAYIGQAAYISNDRSAWSNPFFKTVPPGMFYPSLVSSVLAAIVASQAMITSTFQLLSQLMNTSYFPQIKMVYTSSTFHGQVYIPIANWLMMIGTVIVTVVYNNTTRLGHAYGVCVILVTFITTCMVGLVGIIVWRQNWLLVMMIWLPFLLLDGLFLSSALTKVPDGAWFTLLLAIMLSTVFIVWRYGKEQQWKSEGVNRIKHLRQLIMKGADGKLKFVEEHGGAYLSTIKGLGIFFDKVGDGVPSVYEEFLRKFEAQQEIHIFLHFRALTKPHVTIEEKYTVLRTSVNNCYRLIIRHGYNDLIITPNLSRLVYEQVREAMAHFGDSETSASEGTSSSGQVITSKQESSTKPSASNIQEPSAANETEKRNQELARRMEALDQAFGKQVVYVVGKEHLKLLVEKNNWLKRLVLNVFLWIRENTRSKISKMEVPTEKLVEVGFVKEM